MVQENVKYVHFPGIITRLQPRIVCSENRKATKWRFTNPIPEEGLGEEGPQPLLGGWLPNVASDALVRLGLVRLGYVYQPTKN